MVSFEILVILSSIGLVYLLQQNDKLAWKKYLLIAIGVLLFEYFTQALWLNKGLAPWSYLYLDVNWVLTLGWSTIIITGISVIDYALPSITQKKKYLFYILISSVIGFFAESFVTAAGIREYSPSTNALLSGIQVFGKVPIEALYYIPVFMGIVIAFKMYWEKLLVNEKPISRRKLR